MYNGFDPLVPFVTWLFPVTLIRMGWLLFDGI